MVVLNMRYQRDTPAGMVDVHAFVVSEEDGTYLVYCRSGHKQVSRVVPNERMAISCVQKILDRLGGAVCLSSVSPPQ
jgi:hypothetical protein